MEAMPDQIDLGHLFSRDLLAFRIASFVKFATNPQTSFGSRRGNQADDHCQTDQRLPAPVAADVRKETVLDFVPLAVAGAVWLTDGSGHLQMEYQIGLAKVGLQKYDADRKSHTRLIESAARHGEAQIVAPQSGTGVAGDLTNAGQAHLTVTATGGNGGASASGTAGDGGTAELAYDGIGTRVA